MNKQLTRRDYNAICIFNCLHIEFSTLNQIWAQMRIQFCKGLSNYLIPKERNISGFQSLFAWVYQFFVKVLYAGMHSHVVKESIKVNNLKHLIISYDP